MFKTETIKCQDALGEAVKMIKAQAKGTRMIGSGCYGEVYGAKGCDVVYKMGDALVNDGYLSYINELGRHETHNPYTPKIYGVRMYKDRYNKYFVVAMERLAPHKSRSQRKLMHKVATWFDNNVSEYNDRESATCDVLGVRLIMPQALMDCIKTIKHACFRSNADYDFHAGNFMFRGTQVVCIDPLA